MFTYGFLTHVMLVTSEDLEHGICERVISVEQSRHRQAHNNPIVRCSLVTRRFDGRKREVFCASDFALMTSDRMFSFSVGNNSRCNVSSQTRAFPLVRLECLQLSL